MEPGIWISVNDGDVEAASRMAIASSALAASTTSNPAASITSTASMPTSSISTIRTTGLLVFQDPCTSHSFRGIKLGYFGSGLINARRAARRHRPAPQTRQGKSLDPPFRCFLRAYIARSACSSASTASPSDRASRRRRKRRRNGAALKRKTEAIDRGFSSAALAARRRGQIHSSSTTRRRRAVRSSDARRMRYNTPTTAFNTAPAAWPKVSLIGFKRSTSARSARRWW